MIAQDLVNMGFVCKNEECSYCDGTLWSGNGETVCDTCFVVYDSTTRQYFDTRKLNGDRPTYRSGYKKCFGGFLGSYEWGENEGVFTY